MNSPLTRMEFYEKCQIVLWTLEISGLDLLNDDAHVHKPSDFRLQSAWNCTLSVLKAKICLNPTYYSLFTFNNDSNTQQKMYYVSVFLFDL